MSLWLQVPDVDTLERGLGQDDVDLVEPPIDKPWELRKMRVEDPDGVRLVIVEEPDDHPLRCP